MTPKLPRPKIAHVMERRGAGASCPPATRVGNLILCQGGYVRTLSWWERLRLWWNPNAKVRP